MTVETVASWLRSSSALLCFSAFFFMPNSFVLWRSLLLALLRRNRYGCIRFCVVDRHARTHCRGERDFLNVLTLRRCGLGLDDGCEQRLGVSGQVVGRETDLADRRVNDSGLVEPEFHFTGFHFLNGLRNFEC